MPRFVTEPARGQMIYSIKNRHPSRLRVTASKQTRSRSRENNLLRKGYNKQGVRWLNAALDEKLKELGHDVDSENQQKAEANAAKRAL